MKVAIYVRVSTADQNQELQLGELQDYATRHQWEIRGIGINDGRAVLQGFERKTDHRESV